MKKLKCPECGNTDLDTLESTPGRAITFNGVSVSDDGKFDPGNSEYVEYQGTTDPLYDDQETVGLICACGWSVERPDWPQYMLDYEANEIARMKEELLAIKEGREPAKPSTPPKKQEQYIVLLHDDDLSGSLDPEKANADQLRVFGPFDSMDEAVDWIDETGEDATWLCHVHRIASTDEHTWRPE